MGVGGDGAPDDGGRRRRRRGEGLDANVADGAGMARHRTTGTAIGVKTGSATGSVQVLASTYSYLLACYQALDFYRPNTTSNIKRSK